MYIFKINLKINYIILLKNKFSEFFFFFFYKFICHTISFFVRYYFYSMNKTRKNTKYKCQYYDRYFDNYIKLP